MTILQRLIYHPLLCVATVACALNAVRSEAQEPPGPSTLNALTPQRIVIAFGEPIFLPVAIVNNADSAVDVPSFAGHVLKLNVKVSSGEHVHLLSFHQGMSGESGIELPAHSVEDAVLLVNVWSPGFAKEFLRTQRATLQLHFDGKAEAQDPKARLPVVETELVLEGSVFLPAHQRQLLVLMEDAETPAAGYGTDESPGSTYGLMLPLSPFSIGVTPLAWQTNLKRAESWFDPLSAEKLAASEGIRPGSPVLRMRKIGMLIDAMQKCATLEAWKPMFSEFDQLMEACDASERQWYLGAMAVSRSLSSLGTEAERMQRDNILRRAYPDFAMCFFGHGSYARVSLIQGR